MPGQRMAEFPEKAAMDGKDQATTRASPLKHHQIPFSPFPIPGPACKFEALMLDSQILKMTSQSIDWSQVPKGNTQKGVNRAILQFLKSYAEKNRIESLLDAPCGEGDFLVALRKLFPQIQVEGHDLFCEPHSAARPFVKKTDLREIFAEMGSRKFDVITSISGVMVCDHVSTFIEKAQSHLQPKGLLILTNDNVMTLRDRLSFLFFGRLKRFKLYFSVNEGNWNVILIQALWKLLNANGYRVLKVQYTSIYPEDFLLLPLAVIFYPLMLLSRWFGKGEMDSTSRKVLFPFSALLARHYVIVAQKTDS